jgi:hypothetical protein
MGGKETISMVKEKGELREEDKKEGGMSEEEGDRMSDVRENEKHLLSVP